MSWLQKLFGGGKSAEPMPQPYDPAKFKDGSTVQIGSRAQLEEFLRTWQYHHKLQPEQLAHADRIGSSLRACTTAVMSFINWRVSRVFGMNNFSHPNAPNSAPHRDGREASHVGQSSSAPARGRER